jgi:hypothetical protein
MTDQNIANDLKSEPTANNHTTQSTISEDAQSDRQNLHLENDDSGGARSPIPQHTISQTTRPPTPKYPPGLGYDSVSAQSKGNFGIGGSKKPRMKGIETKNGLFLLKKHRMESLADFDLQIDPRFARFKKYCVARSSPLRTCVSFSHPLSLRCETL